MIEACVSSIQPQLQCILINYEDHHGNQQVSKCCYNNS